MAIDNFAIAERKDYLFLSFQYTQTWFALYINKLKVFPQL